MWKFGVDPFPAYRVNLSFVSDNGEYTSDRGTFPVMGVKPSSSSIFSSGNGSFLSISDNRDNEDVEKIAATRGGGEILAVKEFLLPTGDFNVIRSKEKGTLLIVASENVDDGCLLFTGCSGRPGGGVVIMDDHTTCTMWKVIRAIGSHNSRIECASSLKVGEVLTIYSFGRREYNYVHQWEWQVDSRMVIRHIPKSSWDAGNLSGVVETSVTVVD